MGCGGSFMLEKNQDGGTNNIMGSCSPGGVDGEDGRGG
jgi:hypothetical protein